MKRVLIFGFSGFVGPYLAGEFLSHGYTVIGSDIKDTPNVRFDVAFEKANLLDFDSVNSLITKSEPDIIINLAAISSVGQSWRIPQTTFQVNVVGALNILESSKQLKIKPKIMFVGSSEEYLESNMPLNEESPLNSNNPYGISKIAQERIGKIYKEQYGLEVYCVRPFNHTGIGQNNSFVLSNFCKQVAEIEKSGMPGIVKVGNLEAFRDFSDVRDIVRAYRIIIENNNCETIYNIGSGKAYSLQNLLEYIVSLSSQRISIEIDPERYRPIDTPFICCDNHLITTELGWKPEYDIKTTLKEMFLFFLKND